MQLNSEDSCFGVLSPLIFSLENQQILLKLLTSKNNTINISIWYCRQILCINCCKHIKFIMLVYKQGGLPTWLSGKESSSQCRRCGFNPWMGKIPGEGNGNPLQYPRLGNPMDRGAWQATVHGVSKSQTQLSMHTGPCLNSSIILFF